jgi:hypothetical protein
MKMSSQLESKIVTNIPANHSKTASTTTMPLTKGAEPTFAQPRDMQISKMVTAALERNLSDSVQRQKNHPLRSGCHTTNQVLSDVQTIVEDDMTNQPYHHEHKRKVLQKIKLSPTRQHRPGRYSRRKAIVPSSRKLWDIPEHPFNHRDET